MTQSEQLLCRVRADSGVALGVEVFSPEQPARELLGGDAVGDPTPGDFAVVHREGERLRLLEIVARAGSALAELYAIAVEHGLDPCFSSAVRGEVARLLSAPGIDDPRLHDARHLPLVTIDDASSRDLDQAVAVEHDEGRFVAWYALADASHFVSPGSALYAEALRRGASYYLPDLMIPMLPRELSEGIVSLNPGVDRRAMLFRIEVDEEGRVLETIVRRARVHSRAKLSFEEVQRFLDGQEVRAIADSVVEESLRALHALGRVRVRDAQERDVVHYRRQEVATHLASGLRFVVGASLRLEVERDNEQISLLTNIEGARLLRDRDRDGDAVDPIYRVHGAPPAEKVASFEAFLEALAATHDLEPARFVWHRGGERSLSEFLAALPTEGAEGRVAQAIHRQAVLINGRSVFREQPGAHYGIGADVYARFSAPMREMVGVFVHQELWEALGEPPASLPPGFDSREALRAAIVARANGAKETQKRITREANRLVLDQLLEAAHDDSRWLLGTLVGLTPTKAHVILDEPPIDLKVYLRDAPGLKVDEPGTRLLQDAEVRAAVGDAVELSVLGRDERRDRWRLDIRRP